MSGDFTPKQSDTLIGFVNEQIKDYCHSKVDQRIFQTWLEDHLEIRFNDSERRLMQKIEEKLDERFLQVMEMIKTQSLAINDLSKKMDKIDEKHSLS
jgi:hypothetical protein